MTDAAALYFVRGLVKSYFKVPAWKLRNDVNNGQRIGTIQRIKQNGFLSNQFEVLKHREAKCSR